MELTAGQVTAGALEALEGTGLRLKHRTGGIEAHLLPTPEELAAVLVEAVAARIPFKLTAGLHVAVRYTSPATGLPHHGFLNIAMATEAARAHEPAERVTALLTETDPGPQVEPAKASDGSWRESSSPSAPAASANPPPPSNASVSSRPDWPGQGHLPSLTDRKAGAPRFTLHLPVHHWETSP